VIRVVQWGTGHVGTLAPRTVLGRPVLELVGVKVYDPVKVGIDAGQLAELPPTGIRCTTDPGSSKASYHSCPLNNSADRASAYGRQRMNGPDTRFGARREGRDCERVRLFVRLERGDIAMETVDIGVGSGADA
jgi:hypothetical protein